ncbi:hypothetical protein PGT21_034763 [Puccinia graminis f. sp. tritici]|uniref:Uncharacterized protein n=1 Tax=Puccinia graminis f. sp. tritici TaxID=56615 RepID=A0A5B0R2N9_PUCGR|nr:hypothetical protein PGT21_034763 [Puccinia graminis f. sp. tritici]
MVLISAPAKLNFGNAKEASTGRPTSALSASQQGPVEILAGHRHNSNPILSDSGGTTETVRMATDPTGSVEHH